MSAGKPARGQRYRVTNVTRRVVLAESSEKPGPVGRGIGLIGRRTLPPGRGLIIDPCHSVVSFFMRFAIDVLFIDANNTVVYILRNMVPWRASRIVRQSKYVVELPAGRADETGTDLGDVIQIEPA